jgi:hypothetical protein
MKLSSAPAGLARGLTLAVTVATVLSVVFYFEPRIAAVQLSLSDTEQLLHNDEVAFANTPLLRSERNALREQVGKLLREQPEDTFVQDLGRIARRRRIRVVSTSFQRAPQHAPEVRGTGMTRPARRRMDEEHGSLVLEGSYANLLEAIADLSRGNALVSVAEPSVRRSANSLISVVPLTLFEPPRENVP